MFTSVQIKDAIPVPACELDKPRPLAVSNEIEKKYSNRVIPGVGLCVCLHEIKDLQDGLIYVSDSSVHIRAEFTLVVFRPFIGEVLTGNILKSTPEGLWLSVEFFEDIFIPPHFMMDGTVFDEGCKLWVWKSEHGDAFLDPQLNSPVRFRVTNCKFREEKRPTKAPAAASAAAAATTAHEDEDQEPPMLVMASIKDDGLGLVVWWQ